MDLETFWKVCSSTDRPVVGTLTYWTDDEKGGRLVIRPRTGKDYRIRKGTVGRYLQQNGPADAGFRRNHGWFCQIYDAIRAQIETTNPL